MHTLGAEQSVNLFPAATWSGHHAENTPREDYPGMRPTGSWTLDPDGWLNGVDPVDGRWRNRENGEWLDVADRHLVLGYGSNPDPTKLLKHPELFGGAPVIALRAAVFGWAAVWCDARRRKDRSVVATLANVPGVVEVHPVFALTTYQLDAMDEWEGHPNCYRRIRFPDPVWMDPGEWRTDVEVYLGTPDRRPPLVDGERYLLCAEVPQSRVKELVSE